MIVTPTAEHIARMQIARFLLRQAEDQLKLATPLRCVALLSMHDAIEMFLDTAAEANQVPLSNKRELKEYWRGFAALNPPVALPDQRAVDRLNRARVNLKHNGIRPTDEQMHNYLDITREFLTEACHLCFGIPIHRVSLVDIVKTDEVRDFLASAERELSDGRLSDALASVAKAFAAGFGTIDRSLQGKGLNIILPVLGIDFHNYERYKALTPNIQRSVSGKFMVAWLNKGPSEDPEQVQWSIAFVADFMVRVEARAVGFMGQNV